MSYLRDNCQLLSLSEMILDNCGEFVSSHLGPSCEP